MQGVADLLLKPPSVLLCLGLLGLGQLFLQIVACGKPRGRQEETSEWVFKMEREESSGTAQERERECVCVAA